MHLTARSLAFAHGPVPVLRDVSIDVGPGDRVGVVGPNGVGKSTLLLLLAGELAPSAGEVRRHPASLLVARLHQEVESRPGETVVAYLARRTGVTDAEIRFAWSTEALASQEPGAETAYEAALEHWLAVGAADFAPRFEAALERVGLPADRSGDEVAHLSGGQKGRVDLAAVLLHQAPILLLDEPTNDLDHQGLELLEETILSGGAGVVVVSHDRAFLERVVTEVLELDGHRRTGRRFGGGWASYQHERDVTRSLEREAYDDYTTERDRLVTQARRQREWSEKGVRRASRKPRDNDKNLKRAHIARAEARAGDAGRTDARLGRLETVDKPWEPWRLQLRLADRERSGDVVVSAERAVVERGAFRLGPVDLEVRFGDRIQLVGPNGSGKTTLVDLLLGRLEPAAGRVRLGRSVVVGELAQHRHVLDGPGDVLSEVVQATGRTGQEVRSALAKLGLGAEHVRRPARSLSAGERTRAMLGTFELSGVNLLVLDEPTNHLDLPAIEQLEQALGEFAGTLLVVSHDRRFLEAMSLGPRWELDGGSVRVA